MGNSAKIQQMQTVLTLCGVIVLILFVALLLAVLFVIDDKARHVADKQKDLINAINSNGAARRRSYDPNDVERSFHEGRDTKNTFNTFNSQTYIVSDPNPGDNLITSTLSNGYVCDVPPPIDVLPTSGFFDSTFRTLERIWNRLAADLNIPGVAIGIVYNQRIIYNSTIGFKDENKTVPVAADTLFRIGGLTRLFTAILAFQQRDKGNLRFEESLKTLLPTLNITNPFTSDDISIRSVLSELSGLPRGAPPGCEPYGCNLTTQQVLALIQASGLQLINPPFFLPSRSDLGWALLGRGMESLTGFGKYEDHIKSGITDILGMKDTVFYPDTEQQSRVIDGNFGSGIVPNYDLGWNNPWGGLYSTLNDMFQVLLSLNLVDAADSNGFVRILPSETLRELLLPAFMNPDSKSGQGSPFQIVYFLNRVVRSIAGFVSGYSSHLISVPGLRLSMVVMGNTGSIDMSRFLVPAARLLIPLIENQLIEQAAGPNPPPNATIFEATFSGVDSRGQVGLLSVAGDDSGILTVTDNRLADLAYQLNYIGDLNNGTTQRFKIHLISTNPDGAELLTCFNIFRLGVENDFMDFSNFEGGSYRTLVFQGEQYQKVDAEPSFFAPPSQPTPQQFVY